MKATCVEILLEQVWTMTNWTIVAAEHDINQKIISMCLGPKMRAANLLESK